MSLYGYDNADTYQFKDFKDNTAKEAIFVGGVITGPQTITHSFIAPLEPDVYFFRCDVLPYLHGNFMPGIAVIVTRRDSYSGYCA